MVGIPRILVAAALVLIVAGACATGGAPAAEWPEDRRFVLSSRRPRRSVPAAELGGRGGRRFPARAPLLARGQGRVLTGERVARDASRAHRSRWLARLRAAFGDGARRAFEGERLNVDDEILPLPDGSILFTGYNAIDRLRPDGSIVRFAGTGRYSERASGDGGPATAPTSASPTGLTRLRDGTILFGDGYGRVRRIAPDGTITTIAGRRAGSGFGGDGGPATAAQFSGPERRAADR